MISGPRVGPAKKEYPHCFERSQTCSRPPAAISRIAALAGRSVDNAHRMSEDPSAANRDGGASSGDGADLAPALSAAAGLRTAPQRRDYFDRQPDLRTTEFVEALCREALQATVERSPAAQNYVETACWLAKDLGDSGGHGLSLRAAANLRLYEHDFKGATSSGRRSPG